MNDEKKEYSFLWVIKNYSYSWHKNGEYLDSLEFIADELKGTAWYLRLYPRGNCVFDKGCISLFLERSDADDCPEEILVWFEFSIISENGSNLLKCAFIHRFPRNRGHGEPKFVQLQEVLLSRKAEYLPQDTLKVLCKIRKVEGNIQQAKQIVARTQIGIERISFLHVTEKFSSLEPNQKSSMQIKCPSEDGLDLSISLYYSDDSWREGKIMVEITPNETDQILSRCKISLIEKTGREIECCEADNRFETARDRQDIKILPLSISRQIILNRKCLYLPDDKLSLQFECIFSTGIEFEKIERSRHGLPVLPLNQLSDNDMNNALYYNAEKLNSCPHALDDFKKIFNNQLLTDVELKTKTKSFPAHKVVLCARSSVFEAMLTSDMREKNTDCIQVEDLENDTVQQFLSFLYSDKLENLEWKSAIKLYYVGDKYDVKKLKVMCASYLVDHLRTSNASELLLLADTHNDKELKKIVEDFIMDHEEQVFGSDEWEKLIETNPQLVIKTMHLKYRKNKILE